MNENRFNLETALGTWRSVLSRRPAFVEGDIDELEQHLREHIQHLMDAGHSEERAFREATTRLGNVTMLDAEFRDVFWTKTIHRKTLVETMKNQLAMFVNYLMVAFRSFRRHRISASINILGLSAGIATSLLLFTYVWSQYSFDTASGASDRIYRIQTQDGESADWALTRSENLSLAPQAIAGIESTMRVSQFRAAGFLGSDLLLTVDGQDIYESAAMYYADSTFFSFVGLPLAAGDPATALSAPFRLVISDVMAERLFGDEQAIGRTILVNNEDVYTITGVMGQRPQSHIPLHLIASIPDGDRLLRWGYNYVRLTPGADPQDVGELLNAWYHDTGVLGQFSATERAYLFPVRDIHFSSGFEWEIGPLGNKRYVNILFVTALLLLVIASINFVNLTTAQSLIRSREVGLRKVLGAVRGQLIRQFLTEAAWLTVVAGILALVAVVVIWEPFATFTDLRMPWYDFRVLLGVAGVTALVSLLAGMYPAVVLSGFGIIQSLKGQSTGSDRHSWFRRGLVTAQFSVSIFMIVCTFMIGRQLSFMQSYDLGVTRDQIITFPVRSDEMRSDLQRVKQSLKAESSIQAVTAATNIPGFGMVTTPGVYGDGMPEEDQILMYTIQADESFVETMELEIVAGRDFSRERGTDEGTAFLLNEAAVRRMGWEGDPIGKSFSTSMQPNGTVVGVVKDFHWKSLHDAVEPLAIEYHTSHETYWMRIMAVRVAPESVGDALAYLQENWSSLDPEYPFQYTFMDSEFNRQYQAEERLAPLFRVFSIMSIVIACLGLFGLAWLTVTQRMKEMAVRKVLGASVWSIFILVTHEFLLMMGAAFALAIPITYVAVGGWMSEFAIQAPHAAWPYVLAFVLVFGAAMLSVGYHSLRIASANPVLSLRGD